MLYNCAGRTSPQVHTEKQTAIKITVWDNETAFLNYRNI